LGFILAQFFNVYKKTDVIFGNYFFYFLIPIGLFFYGSQVDFSILTHQNPFIYLLILSSIVLYFFLIVPINRYVFHIVNRKINYILAASNAICGISASIILIPFTDAKKDEVIKVIVSIFIAGCISSILFFYLSSLCFHLNDANDTLLAATTINNTGSALFVTEKINENLIDYAMTIKGLRLSIIIPTSLVLMCILYTGNDESKAETYELFNNSMLYALTLASILVCSSIIFTFLEGFHRQITLLYKLVFCMVLAEIGLTCKWSNILNKTVIINTATSLIAWLLVILYCYFMLKNFYL
jgi:uncharacterized membrane protein YadS